MSKFQTHIPIDIEAVKNALPKGSSIEGVLLSGDHKSVVVAWHNDELRTPYTFPVDITPDMLAGKERMPEFVKTAEEFKRVQNAEVAPNASGAAQKKPVETKPKRETKPKNAKAPSQPAAQPGDQAGSGANPN